MSDTLPVYGGMPHSGQPVHVGQHQPAWKASDPKYRSNLFTAKDLLKAMIYYVGILAAVHRVRNHATLTVVMLHRVLAQDDLRWSTALTPWTISTDVFSQCLVFFKRHYRVVTLDDVCAAAQLQRKLPPRSLLITFDDGYEDNFSEALPALRAKDVSAAVFVSSDAIGQEKRLWTEDLLWHFRTGLLGREPLRAVHAIVMGPRQQPAHPDRSDDDMVWDIMRFGPGCPPDSVSAISAHYEMRRSDYTGPRTMMTDAEIVELARNGIAIGAHGKTHCAMTVSDDLPTELVEPKTVLDGILAGEVSSLVKAMSFPYGAFDEVVAEEAIASGYQAAFGIGDKLNSLREGLLGETILSRINIDGDWMVRNGRLSKPRLAWMLFLSGHSLRRSMWQQIWLGLLTWLKRVKESFLRSSRLSPASAGFDVLVSADPISCVAGAPARTAMAGDGLNNVVNSAVIPPPPTMPG